MTPVTERTIRTSFLVSSNPEITLEQCPCNKLRRLCVFPKNSASAKPQNVAENPFVALPPNDGLMQVEFTVNASIPRVNNINYGITTATGEEDQLLKEFLEVEDGNTNQKMRRVDAR
jgi:hypothetical protein